MEVIVFFLWLSLQDLFNEIEDLEINITSSQNTVRTLSSSLNGSTSSPGMSGTIHLISSLSLHLFTYSFTPFFLLPFLSFSPFFSPSSFFLLINLCICPFHFPSICFFLSQLLMISFFRVLFSVDYKILRTWVKIPVVR